MDQAPDDSSRNARTRSRYAVCLAFALLAACLLTTAVADSAVSDPFRDQEPGSLLGNAADSLATTKQPPAAAAGLSARLAALSGASLRSASHRDQALAVSARPNGPGSLMRAGGRLVTSARVRAVSDHLLEDVRQAGAVVLGTHPDYMTLDLAIAERDLRNVAAVDGVESISEVFEPLVADAGPAPRPAGDPQPKLNTCTGSVVTEADIQMRAAEARSDFGIDGAGTKVGVLSDSFDTSNSPTNAAQDVATGDLPGAGNPCHRATPVQVLAEKANGTDEGRGMLQLVHDLAPGAQLAFASAYPTTEAFADNIRALRSAGAGVIVDDVNYFDEPMFQDGVISNAVNDVTAAGSTYFSSAANNNVVSSFPGGVSGTTGQNIGSWEAPAFRGLGPCASSGGTCMDFNPGPGTDATSTIRLDGGRSLTLDLQWAQPRNGVTTDLDVYVVDQAAGVVVAKGVDVNGQTQKPFELASVQNPTGSARFYDIFIDKFSGAANPRLKYAMLASGGVSGAEYDVSLGSDRVGPTIFGHNGAANAVSTAAVPFNNSATVEDFSSRGPVTLYFGPVTGTTPAAPLGSPQVLAKPDIAATDAGQTTFFGTNNPPFRFSGTSAAAPDAAAVAALQLDAANGALTVAQVRSAQTATASPVGGFGSDAAGAGLINAVGAVAANPPQPPDTILTKVPKDKIRGKRATYAFTSNAPEATFRCKLDRGKFRACPSPVKVVHIPYGKHTFTVEAVANGLTDPSPTKDKFKRTG